MISKGRLEFRLATIADADVLLKWRNDSQTRASSHDTGLIDKKEHIEWLEASLKNNKRKIYIVEFDGTPVGTIRTDKKDGVIKLSWTVVPEARGQGIGKEMVKTFTSQIIGRVRAEVKVGNEASKRIAEYAGMKVDREENGILYYQ
jgi:RimJ/RimL family protein N-acetyltransferase